MKKASIMHMIVALLFVGTILVGCSSDTGGGAGTTATGTATGGAATHTAKVGASVGNTAPDFQLTRTDGSTVSLNDLHGAPAVLVFWTAWCPSCKDEAPHINDLAAQYGSRGVRVLGINIKDSQARTEGGIKDFGIRYPVARDADAAVTRTYKVTGTPTIILLDSKGVVRYSGHALPEDYAARLEAMIAEQG